VKQILANRSLLTIGIAESLTDLGNWVTVLACFALIVFHNAGGAAESGGILLALLVPALPVSPLAGWLSDRYDRKRVMQASKLLAVPATLGLVLANRLEFVYGFLALQTACSALVVPPRQAAIYQLVPREDLSRANAFLQQLSSIVKIAGPLLAGVLLAIITPQQAILLDAGCLALAALLLARLPAIPPPRAARASAGEDTAFTSIGTASAAEVHLRTAFRDSSALRGLFLVLLIDSAIVATFDVLGSVFTRDALHGDETLYSVLISLVGAGAVASTLFLLVARAQRHLWRDVVLGVLLFGAMPATFVLVSFWPSRDLGLPALALLVLGALLGGVANGLFGVQTSTLLQLLSPAGLLGRMEGLFQGTAVAGQLGAFLVTPLLVPAVLSAAGVFVGDTVGLVLLALLLALGVRRAAGTTDPRILTPARPGTPVGPAIAALPTVALTGDGTGIELEKPAT
jgi:MFS family permease